jgi:hypothetical protein
MPTTTTSSPLLSLPTPCGNTVVVSKYSPPPPPSLQDSAPSRSLLRLVQEEDDHDSDDGTASRESSQRTILANNNNERFNSQQSMFKAYGFMLPHGSCAPKETQSQIQVQETLERDISSEKVKKKQTIAKQLSLSLPSNSQKDTKKTKYQPPLPFIPPQTQRQHHNPMSPHRHDYLVHGHTTTLPSSFHRQMLYHPSVSSIRRLNNNSTTHRANSILSYSTIVSEITTATLPIPQPPSCQVMIAMEILPPRQLNPKAPQYQMTLEKQ